MMTYSAITERTFYTEREIWHSVEVQYYYVDSLLYDCALYWWGLVWWWWACIRCYFCCDRGSSVERWLLYQKYYLCSTYYWYEADYWWWLCWRRRDGGLFIYYLPEQYHTVPVWRTLMVPMIPLFILICSSFLFCLRWEVFIDMIPVWPVEVIWRWCGEDVMEIPTCLLLPSFYIVLPFLPVHSHCYSWRIYRWKRRPFAVICRAGTVGDTFWPYTMTEYDCIHDDYYLMIPLEIIGEADGGMMTLLCSVTDLELSSALLFWLFGSYYLMFSIMEVFYILWWFCSDISAATMWLMRYSAVLMIPMICHSSLICRRWLLLWKYCVLCRGERTTWKRRKCRYLEADVLLMKEKWIHYYIHWSGVMCSMIVEDMRIYHDESIGSDDDLRGMLWGLYLSFYMKEGLCLPVHWAGSGVCGRRRRRKVEDERKKEVFWWYDSVMLQWCLVLVTEDWESNSAVLIQRGECYIPDIHCLKEEKYSGGVLLWWNSGDTLMMYCL